MIDKKHAMAIPHELIPFLDAVSELVVAAVLREEAQRPANAPENKSPDSPGLGKATHDAYHES